MGGDRLTRGLLLAILAWLLLLTVLELRRGDTGRFEVTPLRAGSPVLVRTDTATGDSWRLDLRAGGERWVPIRDGEVPAWSQAPSENADASGPDAAAKDASGEAPRPLASDEIKALANAILGDDLTPDIRIWAVGQLAATPDRRATLALAQLYEVVDDPQLVALIREALTQRDDPRAKRALERRAQEKGSS
ncbi:MAG TPA: hypothetical protein VMW19_09860 [Myxococcota bacterium]|nr:hypothetical protein [Myxococcota bacterium]